MTAPQKTPPLTLIVLASLAIIELLAQNTDVDRLLNQLKNVPLDKAVLYSLEAHSSDRILPALRAAFDGRGDKREKQEIAATLLRLGERSDKYFEFLAVYARASVEDRAPLFQKYDFSGRAMKGAFSDDFKNWCSQNGKDPAVIAGLQLREYPEDLLILVEAQDRRALKLFRVGLDSPNPLVVAYCVQGLGRLAELSALPLIAKAYERLPHTDGSVIARQLPWFPNADAEQLLSQMAPDAKLQDYYRNQVRQQRQLELARILSRQNGQQ